MSGYDARRGNHRSNGVERWMHEHEHRNKSPDAGTRRKDKPTGATSLPGKAKMGIEPAKANGRKHNANDNLVCRDKREAR